MIVVLVLVGEQVDQGLHRSYFIKMVLQYILHDPVANHRCVLDASAGTLQSFFSIFPLQAKYPYASVVALRIDGSGLQDALNNL